MSSSEANLSSRAHVASLPSPAYLIWDIYTNLYSPTNPSGFVSLGVAENVLMHKSLTSYINKIDTLPTQSLTYGDGPTGSKKLKGVLSTFLTKGLKAAVPVRPDHLVVTSGVTSAIEHCSWAFCNPGEGMLLGQPHYGAFMGDIEMRPEGKVIKVPFGPDIDPIGPDCVSAYEKALSSAKAAGIKTTALMLCNPHNPLGRCYSRSTLLKLMDFCAKNSLHLISDEIYAFSTWSNTVDPPHPAQEPFTSLLSIPQTTTSLPLSHRHTLWGTSKDFCANGLRLGVIISQANPTLHLALRSVALHSAPSSLADHVVSTILADEPFTRNFLSTNQRLLSESYAYVTAWAKRHRIPYAPGVNAAFFLWCDFGAVWKRSKHAEQNNANETPLQREAQDVNNHNNNNNNNNENQSLTSEIHATLLQHKIFLASGETFGSERPGWFRIVFSQPRPYLVEGLKRIVRALGLDNDDDDDHHHHHNARGKEEEDNIQHDDSQQKKREKSRVSKL